ncbi:hypothetical protein Nepgr_026628 [Nepenthes gracilis]|uniref:Uncharacterized protein n=1 Tax=Nepenthes gracilis TaxID=150966 RepID=A0AAD3T783_NEPGR|nr:hypothetical protein Nepgr_026628 [Nepenthes gracilis]
MAGLLTSRFAADGVLGAADFCDAPFHSKYYKLPLHLFMEAMQAMLIFYTRSCRMPMRCCYVGSVFGSITVGIQLHGAGWVLATP